MNLEYLDFEKPIQEIDEKINSLDSISSGDKSIDTKQLLQQLLEKREKELTQIFSSLNDWQITQIARHPNRPKSNDYINNIFDEFIQLNGDRLAKNDSSIVCGLAKLEDKPFVFIGQQKGSSIEERIKCNFGMSKPEGYRKAKRMMLMAEKFNLPLITFIDTPGAYPGIDAEKNGQSISIADNIYTMSNLKTPIISIIIGEGGSGGALALAVADKILMFEYSIYSVISPEGCASILYKNKDKTQSAAESLKLSSNFLLEKKLIDQVIKEPIGGVHRDNIQGCNIMKKTLIDSLDNISKMSIGELVNERQKKILSFGKTKNTNYKKSLFID